MRRFSSPLRAGAILLLAGFAGSSAWASPDVAPRDPANLLIGTWRLSGEVADKDLPGVHCETTDLVFTPTQQTTVAKGKSDVSTVTYKASPTVVQVIGEEGFPYATYKVLDQSHVQLRAMVPCNYQRIG